jgi:hypothetical protein
LSNFSAEVVSDEALEVKGNGHEFLAFFGSACRAP